MLALSIFLSLSFVWEYYQFAYIMCGGGVSYLHINNEGFIILAFIIYLKSYFTLIIVQDFIIVAFNIQHIIQTDNLRNNPLSFSQNLY